MPGFLDRHRAARLMRDAGLDALVLAQPESIVYATGAFPGVATYWRRAGAAFVLVPADETAPLAAIVGDLQAKDFATQSGIADVRSHRIWVESGALSRSRPRQPRRSPRPAQYDLVCVAQPPPRPARRAWSAGRADRSGTRLHSGRRLSCIQRACPSPGRTARTLVERLRAIKAPLEIEHLRNAAEYAARQASSASRRLDSRRAWTRRR